MEIKTRVNVGEYFYVIGKRNEDKIVTCTGCKGDGVIRLNDGDLFDCPKCEGHGVITIPVPGPKWELKVPPWQDDNPPNEHAHKLTFTQINVRDMGNGVRTWVLYDHIKGGGTFNEDICFPTLEAAQNEIDRLNSKSENENS